MTAPDTHQKIPLTIRLEKWLFDKLEAAAGQKTKNEYIKEILIAHLGAPEAHQISTTTAPTLHQERTRSAPEQDIGESSRELIIELELKDKIIEAKDQTIRTLENQNGFLIAEFQRERSLNERLLMPSQEEQKDKPRWFEFWK
jgi:hypothetical protein